MTTDLDVDLDAAPPDTDDHEPYAHVATQADIAQALLTGGEVTALCGHRFKVRLFNPAGLPVCPKCSEILAALP